MLKVTSAYANKLLKSLEEDKSYWVNKEETSNTYVANLTEEPVIPEYDYKEVASIIEELDRKIAIIKHAINLNNTLAKIKVLDEEMSIDMILIKMAQFNRRKYFLDRLRKQMPKTREDSGYAARNINPEYRYINYDLDLVKAEYERISKAILELQMELDKYNQTVEFDLDLDI